jgi:hypothetical protein
MSKHIEPDELAQRLIVSLVKRDFGDDVAEHNLEHGIAMLTKIVGRMHGNREVEVRETLHDMVKLNKLYAMQEDYEQENVVYWMMCIMFGNGFDLEYSEEGILVNERAEV